MNRVSQTGRLLFVVSATLMLCGFAGTAFAETVRLFYDSETPQHVFAASDIRSALEARKFTVEVQELSSLSGDDSGRKVVIARASDSRVIALLEDQTKASRSDSATRSSRLNFNSLGEQAFAIRTTNAPALSYWVLGGDDNGAMYGALQVAESIQFNGMTEAINDNDTPHLRNRGIKFNIPLDKEAPTYFYDNRGTANRLAIRHVWDMEFWKTWFDEMARHRYNVLSLWNPHPFTSMLNMEDDYPGVAINGVTGFDKDGNEIQINDWSIDQKVAFWKAVMKYGHERGFRIYVFTWNIFLSTAEGKHGIGEGPKNKATRVYLHQCTRQLFETYPHLTGMGLTVGENMDTEDNDLKEEWGWDSYGSAMLEVAKANPERQFTFIHRLLESDLTATTRHFQALIDQPNVRFDISHKYSNAHAHASTTPIYWKRKKLEPQLEKLGITSWLTIRNDDWFFLHWADPQFIRDYVANFPEVGKTIDGIYIGSDGWVFSRVFTSKDSYFESRNALDIHKTWLMQKIWGRIAYNPAVADDLFKSHLRIRYPEASTNDLFESWTQASRAVRLFNEQVTGNWSLDFHWMPERWTDKDEGYRTLKDLIDTEPMDGSPLADIKTTASGKLDDGQKSALTNADEIERLALEAQRRLSTIEPGANKELGFVRNDIDAMIHLSLVGASKIRAAVFLEQNKLADARSQMLTAYLHWIAYANIMDASYIGVDMQRNHHFKSWHQLDTEVLRDLIDLGGPVNVDPAKPYPWVRIVSPTDRSEVLESANIELQINAAADNKSSVTVELFRDGRLIHTTSDSSFTHSLTDLSLGEHTLTARVTDGAESTREHNIRLTTFDDSTRNTLPWREEFTHVDATKEDNARTTWKVSRREGIFEVKNEALIINDEGGEGEFRSGEIDISGGPVKISVEVRPEGVDTRDSVILYAKVDGGSLKRLAEFEGKPSEPTILSATVEGRRLIVIIKAEVSSDDEIFHLDNVTVTR